MDSHSRLSAFAFGGIQIWESGMQICKSGSDCRATDLKGSPNDLNYLSHGWRIFAKRWIKPTCLLILWSLRGFTAFSTYIQLLCCLVLALSPSHPLTLFLTHIPYFRITGICDQGKIGTINLNDHQSDCTHGWTAKWMVAHEMCHGSGD